MLKMNRDIQNDLVGYHGRPQNGEQTCAATRVARLPLNVPFL